MDNKVKGYFFLSFLPLPKKNTDSWANNKQKKTVSRKKIFLNFLFRRERKKKKRSREDKEKKKKEGFLCPRI